jgi:hypothetical protein
VFVVFGLLIINKPMNVISPLTTINSLSNTYPPINVFEFAFRKKQIAGDNKQMMGTSLSLTPLLFKNKPNP